MSQSSKNKKPDVANRRYRFGFFAALILVSLRVLIGLQFLLAGVDKFDPSFSSAGFLQNAHGPLAAYYGSFAPLPHRWNELGGEALPATEPYETAHKYLAKGGELSDKPTKTDRLGHLPYPTDGYGAWAHQIADDWNQTLEQFKKLPGVSEEQQKEAKLAFDDRYVRLAHFIEENRAGLATYHHDLQRLADMKQKMAKEGATGTLSFMDERVAAMEAKLKGTAHSWLVDVDAMQSGYHQSLRDLRTQEQISAYLLLPRERETEQQQAGSQFSSQLDEMLDPPTTLQQVDTLVKWLTLIVGLCLILGLATRLAALAGAGFLVSVISTQPPWAAGVPEAVQLLVTYQGIEVLTLLLLAVLGAGAWAGMDGYLFRRKSCCGKQKA